MYFVSQLLFFQAFDENKAASETSGAEAFCIINQSQLYMCHIIV